MTIIPVSTVIKEKSGTKARTGKTTEMATAIALPTLMTGSVLLFTIIMHHVFNAATVLPGWQKNIMAACLRDKRRSGEWVIRYPRDVIFYDLPHVLLQQLGNPGPDYRYVRVAADILLIAMGTGMVIDAIQDLSGM